MYLAPKAAFRALSKHDVRTLYHANSVRTACTFLRTGGLWSRGAVADAALDQTSQASDQGDIENDVWHDVFLDGVDVHGRAARRSVYGPVLFAIDAKILKADGAHPVRVTRSNPITWTPLSHPSGDYFESVVALREGYIHGEFKMSVTVRVPHGPFLFGKYLQTVYLDKVRLKNDHGRDVFSEGAGALLASARAGGFDMKTFTVDAHSCRSACTCRAQYEGLSEDEVDELFGP